MAACMEQVDEIGICTNRLTLEYLDEMELRL